VKQLLCIDVFFFFFFFFLQKGDVDLGDDGDVDQCTWRFAKFSNLMDDHWFFSFFFLVLATVKRAGLPIFVFVFHFNGLSFFLQIPKSASA
jgi:hypothetical protein